MKGRGRPSDEKRRPQSGGSPAKEANDASLEHQVDDTAELLSAAVRYAEQGRWVLPCKADKSPIGRLVPNGVKDATDDPDLARDWWVQEPDALIGLATGDDRVVIDEDGYKAGGLTEWEARCADHGGLPQTYTVRTQHGGWQRYFKKTQRIGNSTSKIARNVDVRGDGGYGIAPPTPGYTVELDVPEAPLPDWLADLLVAPEHELVELDDAEREAAEAALTDAERAGRRRYFDAAVQDELDRLLACTQAKQATYDSNTYDGPPWDSTTYEVACNLVEIGTTPGSGLMPTEALLLVREHAPRDAGFDDRTIEEKIDSALTTVGNKARDCSHIKMIGGVLLDAGDDNSFWDARPELAQIQQFAYSRMAVPWAMLAAVLARIVAAIPPFVTLPAIIGGEASLNLFCAVVGASGDGKGAAENAAKAAVEPFGGELFTEISAGSGEGLAHLFRKRVKGEIEVVANSALLSIAEIDTLVGLKARQGSTLLPELRKAWMGEPLGFAYADPAKRLPVHAHTYRLCLLAGVQPTRAGVLLDDTDGGTPQRFLWLSSVDPAMPLTTPEPPRLRWSMPRDWGMAINGLACLPVCSTATDTIRLARWERARGNGDALDGHALLQRLKVAAALGLLAGRPEVSDEDWQLAEVVMRRSDRTRDGVVATLEKANRQANTARAMDEGRRDVIRSEVVDDAHLQRACRAILNKLRREENWCRGKDARDAIASPLRHHYDEAVDKLVKIGQVEVEHVERGTAGHGGSGARLRLTSGSQ